MIIYTYSSHQTSALKAVVVGKYVGVEVKVEDKEKAPKELSSHPLFSLKNYDTVWPVLVSENGPLYGSNAIARYVASFGGSSLFGKTPIEHAQVDQWVDTTANDLFQPVVAWVYPSLGLLQVTSQELEFAKAQTLKYFDTLEKHLLTKTFLVGERISLADIVLSFTLLDLFRTVFDASLANKYKNLTRWFLTVVNQPNIKSVIGEVKVGSSSKAQAPQKGKATQKQQVADSPEEAAAKKSSISAPVEFPTGELFGLGLTLDQRYELCRSVGEECIQEDELKLLLSKKESPVCYDGFEPSGRMHIAQGILKTINVNKLTKAGCTFVFWIADWFALLNNKMDGNLANIQTVGKYLIEIWKACGMNMEKVQFLWASEQINAHANEYWLTVMDIARRFNVPRIKRCSKIMGRNEEDDLSAAQILYPCMQCADIFYLKADICQLGMDQRKVNVLAREYCDLIKKKFKPIILSHHMLMGLLEGQEKMSKSNPESAIFMEDEEADVNRKIKRAFCPPQVVEGNPCLDYMKHIVFEKNPTVTVERSERDGGPKSYNSYSELEADYVAGGLHPGDLKNCLSKYLNLMIQPVRDHFKNDPEAKKLLEKVKKLRITK